MSVMFFVSMEVLWNTKSTIVNAQQINKIFIPRRYSTQIDPARSSFLRSARAGSKDFDRSGGTDPTPATWRHWSNPLASSSAFTNVGLSCQLCFFVSMEVLWNTKPTIVNTQPFRIGFHKFEILTKSQNAKSLMIRQIKDRIKGFG